MNNSNNQSDKQLDKFCVHNAVGAQIKRQGKGANSYFSYSLGVEWNVSEDVAVNFVRQIESKFVNKLKLYNFFKKPDSGKELVLADKLKALESDNGFLKLAVHILDKLESSATAKSATSLADSYVVITHYSTDKDVDDSGRLLVVLLDSKSGFNFNEEYEPKSRVIINVDSLKQAAMIDVTLFEEVYPALEGESYLHFIQGNQSSNFFKEALECGQSIANKESISAMFNAIDDFSDSLDLSIGERDKIYNKVEKKLFEYAKSRKSKAVHLSYVQSWIDEILSDDHKGKGKFSEYVSLNGYQVNEWTEPSRSSIYKASTFTIQDEKKSYTCVVSKSAIGPYGSGKKVKLDKGGNHIMIPLSEEDKQDILNRTTDND